VTPITLVAPHALAVVAFLSTAHCSPLTAQAQGTADEYTRYELLAPESGSFRIRYEVTATSPGARFYWNGIRKGSEATDESVTDPATGRPLRFQEVDGQTAKVHGLTDADPASRYIEVALPRPVPANGEIRILIEKTYRDPKSYYPDGAEIVFDRPLGIRRNSVVLPAGYELIRCNVPSQVLSLPDGRVYISFLNAGPGPAALVLRGRRLGS
jgi:hypothetical protein